MKKLILCSIALALCIAAGCKKDNKKTTATAKTYLLKQQVTDDRAEGIPLDTANYQYDDQNRVTTITDGSGNNKISFTITYDGQGRVATAKKLNYSNALIIQYDFVYDGSNVSYYLHGPTGAADTATFSFNGQQQVTEIRTKHSGRTTFTYDSRGNVGTTQLYTADDLNKIENEDAYGYDSEKNPFSQVPAGNLFLEYIVLINNPSTLINNIATKDADAFSYTYNADHYPVSAVITLLDLKKIYVYYSYTVK